MHFLSQTYDPFDLYMSELLDVYHKAVEMESPL